MIRAAAVVVLSVVGCAAPSRPADGIRIADAMATRALIGSWEWRQDSADAATTSREREHWTFAATDDWLTVRGDYHRAVDRIARDGVPFTCSQRPTYQLVSDVELRAYAVHGGAAIEEVGYRTAPSPCDHGLRTLATYRATIEGEALVLTWPGGTAHLTRTDPRPPPPPPRDRPAPAGPWRWSSTSWTPAGLVQHEDERWELTAAADGELAGWYVRTVSIHDPTGAAIACAGAPSYRFVDRYLIRGRALVDLSTTSPVPATAPVDDDRPGDWRFAETAVAAGRHPCLTSSRRTLDSATFDVIGDALILSWRGSRRQVLLRPPA